MHYFEDLNYTLSNEDTRVEANLLSKKSGRVFSIAGSGARVLPLIAKNPKEIDIVDMSQEQLYLNELRIAAARELTYDEFLFFFGYRGGLPNGDPQGDDRLSLFSRLELSDPCKQFWGERAEHWTPRGFILLGRWEGHFQKLGFLFRSVLRMDVRPIFEAHSLDQQLELFRTHWKPLVFKAFLRLVANEYVFNRFLYKGHFAGSSERRTESRPPYKFIDDEFTRLFTTTLVRKNYFLQILFLGGIFYEEGLPLEAQASTIEALKKSKTKVNYLRGDLTVLLGNEAYDFISLSDTISYLPETAASNILQSLHKDTTAGSRVIIRSFLRAPTAVNTTGWKELTEEARKAEATDGTGVYQFHIYEKKG